MDHACASRFISRARHGDVIVVTDRGRPVAQVGPVESDPHSDARELAARFGIPWQAGVPQGMPLGQAARLDDAHALARAIEEDRGECSIWRAAPS